MGAAITATGAVTAVGLAAAGACAAIRAGVARPSPIEHSVVDAETQELVPLTGHPLAGYTDGFQLLGRWIRLARGAMADLLAQPGVPPRADTGFWGRTALAIVIAPPDDDVFLTDEGGALRAIEADYSGVDEVPVAPGGEVRLGRSGGQRRWAGGQAQVREDAEDAFGSGEEGDDPTTARHGPRPAPPVGRSARTSVRVRTPCAVPAAGAGGRGAREGRGCRR